MNLEHLKDIGAKDDRPHLETFRLNVLHIAKRGGKTYLSVGEMLDGAETVNDLSVDYSVAQTGMDPVGVSSKLSMYALERLRQLYHCNRTLYLHIFGKLCTYVKDAYNYTNNANYQSFPKAQQWHPSAQKELSDLNAAMDTELGSALSKEVGFVGEKYKDWGCPGTDRMSPSDAISRAYDVHRAISKLSSISPEIVDQLLTRESSVNKLIDWLHGYQTITRKYMKTDMTSPVSQNYLLFVKQVYPKPYNRLGQQVVLNNQTVVVSSNQQTYPKFSLDFHSQYDLLVRIKNANGSTHTYVDQKDFMSLTKDWGRRNDWIRIFIAFNMFDLAHMWVVPWGDKMRLSNSGPGLYKTLSQNNLVQPLLKQLTEFRDKMYSQAQFETIIGELVGEKPDLSLGSPPDVSKSNEARAVKQMPFLDPKEGDKLEMARTVGPMRMKTEENFSASEEEPIDMHKPPRRRGSVTSDAAPPPPAPRRRPTVVVEEESQTGMYIAALVGIIALAMY
jgi:hypothetical protein